MKQNIRWEDLKNSNSYIDLYKFISEADFTEMLKMINDGYGYDDDYYFDILNEYKIPIDFKLKVRFTKSDIEKSIILNFDSFRITIIEDKNKSEISNKPSKQKSYYNYKIEPNSDINNTIKKRVFEAILDDTSSNNSIDVKNVKPSFDDRDAFQSAFELILNLVDKQLGNDKKWEKLIDKDKKDLFFKSILLHMQLNTAIYSVLSKYFDNSFHFDSARDIPKYNYKIENGKFNDKEYYSLLNKIPDESLSGENFSKDQKFMRFLKENNLGDSIYTEKTETDGKLKLQHNNTTIDLADTSSGLLQIFPILAKIVFWETYVLKDDKAKFSIEEPELHLHPKLQSKLIGFLLGENDEDKNVNLIITTHSEHIIKKLQVMFAKGKITDDDVNINYFDNKNGNTKVKKMEIEENGFFKEPWPNGFFDEGMKLTKELLFSPKEN